MSPPRNILCISFNTFDPSSPLLRAHTPIPTLLFLSSARFFASLRLFFHALPVPNFPPVPTIRSQNYHFVDLIDGNLPPLAGVPPPLALSSFLFAKSKFSDPCFPYSQVNLYKLDVPFLPSVDPRSDTPRFLPLAFFFHTPFFFHVLRLCPFLFLLLFCV